MRPPDQNVKGVANDLKHLQKALDRAQLNIRRNRELNARIIELMSELILIYMQETLAASIKKTNRWRAKVSKVA